jgi:hypothetical protein
MAQLQATARLVLEAQQAQNRILERYLDMQERLLLHYSQNTAPQPVAKAAPLPPVVAERRESVATPMATTKSTGSALRPPVPIPSSPTAPPRPPIAPVAHPSKSASNGSHTAGAENGFHVNRSAKPAAVVAANGNEPPPTEVFRHDLLDIVSARTGYPIDALDENLAL